MVELPKIDLKTLTPAQRDRIMRIMERMPEFQRSQRIKHKVREALIEPGTTLQDIEYALFTTLIWVALLNNDGMRGPARDWMGDLIDRLMNSFDNVTEGPAIKEIVRGATIAKRGGRDATAEFLRMIHLFELAAEGADKEADKPTTGNVP